MSIYFSVFTRTAHNVAIWPNHYPDQLPHVHYQVVKGRVVGAGACEPFLISDHQLCVFPDVSSDSNYPLQTDSAESGCGTDKDCHATVASPPTPSPSAPATAPTCINGYELLSVIGRGGYGKVGAEAFLWFAVVWWHALTEMS